MRPAQLGSHTTGLLGLGLAKALMKSLLDRVNTRSSGITSLAPAKSKILTPDELLVYAQYRLHYPRNLYLIFAYAEYMPYLP